MKAGTIVLPSGADRKLSGWVRPAMNDRHFMAAYKVAVPSSELRAGILELPEAPVHWGADPGPGRAIQFIILLVSSRIRNLTLSDPGTNDDRLHDHFRLPNGENLAVVSRCVPLSDAAIGMIRSAVGSWTLRCLADQEAGARCTMIVEDVDGGEAVLDLAIPCQV